MQDTVRIYDLETKTITTIPARELSDAMIAASVQGIDGIVYVDRNKLKPGPVRQDLPPELIPRIKRLAMLFSDVLHQSVEEWTDSFSRDADPESELRVWERIAEKYATLADPADLPQARAEIVRILLACSSNDTDVVRLTAACQYLSKKDVERVCEEWCR